jgi:hypothetical protein
MSKFGLTAAQEASERLKWKAAAEFYAATKVMDLSCARAFPFNTVYLPLNVSSNSGVKWRILQGCQRETPWADDGVFYENDVRQVVGTVNYSRPAYISFDIEVLPEFGTWASVGYKSANFQRRLQPGETRSAATLRMAQGWLGELVSEVKKARPGIKPYLLNA